MEKYDVVIVGGGIAGLSTAMHVCTKVDATVLVIDKSEIGDPRKTSPFTFSDIVEKYGLTDAVLQEYNGFSYESPTGVVASFQYDCFPLVTIDYQKACAALLGRARKEGNVEVMERTEATGFEFEKALFRASIQRLALSNSTKVTCDVLVDASGKTFFSRRQLGIHPPPLYSHPYGELLTNCSIQDPNRMFIFAGKKYGNGGGWLYPIDKKTARFGFAVVTTSPDFPQTQTEQNFKNALASFHPYNKMLEGAETVRPELGTIPLGPLKRFLYGRTMIIGDAAGHATPWYCEGIRPGVEAGEMCAAAIVDAYKKGEFSKRNLGKYQELWDDKYRRLYSQTTKNGFHSWFRDQGEWDRAVKSTALLKPDEMIARIRYSQF